MAIVNRTCFSLLLNGLRAAFAATQRILRRTCPELPHEYDSNTADVESCIYICRDQGLFRYYGYLAPGYSCSGTDGSEKFSGKCSEGACKNGSRVDLFLVKKCDVKNITIYGRRGNRELSKSCIYGCGPYENGRLHYGHLPDGVGCWRQSSTKRTYNAGSYSSGTCSGGICQ
ncbi:uncharacterized protein LOC135392913 [Ornithodoros turicata]|uniref:uncharacterized protein LOC135392913 n=1 Tax=Ornithodoros turicata TaxID=34597 RepID=UPI00313A06DE